jgi:hypothetical protein
MSVVTGFVLVCSLAEQIGWAEHPPGSLEQINDWLASREFQGLADSADDHALGNKHPQFFLYMAGYNYFPEDEFIAFFQTLRWFEPERVVLMLQPEYGPTRVVRPDPSSELPPPPT